jgi:hypothetical protein
VESYKPSFSWESKRLVCLEMICSLLRNDSTDERNNSAFRTMILAGKLRLQVVISSQLMQRVVQMQEQRAGEQWRGRIQAQESRIADLQARITRITVVWLTSTPLTPVVAFTGPGTPSQGKLRFRARDARGLA